MADKIYSKSGKTEDARQKRQSADCVSRARSRSLFTAAERRAVAAAARLKIWRRSADGCGR